MTYESYIDMLVWTQRNLRVTTRTIDHQWVDVWHRLETDDPATYQNLAMFGYCKYQLEVNGRKKVPDSELHEFLQQFALKMRLATVRNDIATDLPFFEVSEEVLPYRYLH